MKVLKSDAVAILVKLGFAAAPGWPERRLLARIRNLHESVTEDECCGDQDLDNVLDEIIAAGDEGEEIELVNSMDDKPKKKRQPKAAIVEVEEDEEADQVSDMIDRIDAAFEDGGIAEQIAGALEGVAEALEDGAEITATVIDDKNIKVKVEIAEKPKKEKKPRKPRVAKPKRDKIPTDNFGTRIKTAAGRINQFLSDEFASYEEIADAVKTTRDRVRIHSFRLKKKGLVEVVDGKVRLSEKGAETR